MATEQRSRYAALQPLERFRVLRQGYDALGPTREMKAHTKALVLWVGIPFPKTKAGKFPLEALRDWASPENRAKREALKTKEEDLQVFVDKQRQQRADSDERQLFLEDMRELLYSASVPHTDEFYGVVLGILDEKFVDRLATGRIVILSEEAIMTDPYRVGGFFHPAFAQGVESVVYSYYYNSANTEGCIWLEFDEIARNSLSPMYRELGLRETYEPSQLHDHEKHEIEIQAKKARVLAWREQYLALFGQEPYTEVSYHLRSWRDDSKRKARKRR